MSENDQEYIVKGVSAPRELWEEVDRAAEADKLNPGGRSRLVRKALELYLKGIGNGNRNPMVTTKDKV